MLKWLEFLNRKYPAGIYTERPRRVIEWSDKFLSLNRYYGQYVRKQLGFREGTPTPRWVSEFYQCVSVGVAVVLLLAASFLPSYWARCTAASLALYRPFEIVLFSVAWVFIHKNPLHSYNRTLVGFVINIIEIILFYAAAYQGFGFVLNGDGDVITAIYSSLRTTVTIGPTQTLEPPQSWFAGILISTQILTSYFLSVIIVANVVGTLRKRDVQG